METATKNLENDHVYILRLIEVMKSVIRTEKPQVEDMETIVRLIKEYADGFHHAKEENLLFPLLAERGFSAEQGPVAVMIAEHVQGRLFIQGMSEGIAGFRNGDENSTSRIFENMNSYINLLTNHISKENNILFRMADNALSEKDQQALLSEFSKVEKSLNSDSAVKDWINLIEKLEVKYQLTN